MPIKDKFFTEITDNPLHPDYDMETLIKKDLYTSYYNPKPYGLHKASTPKQKIKPKIIPPRDKPKTLGIKFKPKQNSCIALGQRLTRIDSSIQSEKDLTKKTQLVQEYYDVSKQLDVESERVFNKNKSGADNDT